MEDELENLDEVQDHLWYLSTAHYVVAGFSGLFSFFPVIHLVIGIMVLSGGMNEGGKGPPELFGWFFVVIAAGAILLGLTFTGLLIAAGYYMGQHKGHQFCLIVAGISCLFVPFGTVLGVLSIITLTRKEAKYLFGELRNEKEGASGPHTHQKPGEDGG